MTVSPTATATPASSIFRNACPRTSPSKNGIVCAPAHMSDIVDGGACCSRQKSAAEERGGGRRRTMLGNGRPGGQTCRLDVRQT